MALPHVVAAGDVTVAIAPPEALEQIWNDNMLGGYFARSYNGALTRLDPALCPPPSGWVWIHDVASTRRGLSVIDLRERRVLKSHGGWVLEGGLLGRLEVDAHRIELYGRRAIRHELYLQPWPHVWIGDKSWNPAHEFYLLRREKRTDRAAVLRRWTLPDAEASGATRSLPEPASTVMSPARQCECMSCTDIAGTSFWNSSMWRTLHGSRYEGPER